MKFQQFIRCGWSALALSTASASLIADTSDWAITGAVVHPVVGPTVTNGIVAVHAGHIISVGTNAPQSGATLFDASGLHLYPGLFATATTLGLIEIDSVRATIDTSEVGEFLPEAQAWQAVNPDSEVLPVTRANGIAHAEVIPAGASIAGYSSVIQLSGWTTEHLAVRRLAALHVYWPSFRLDLAPKSARGDGWKSVEDQLKERSAQVREIDEYFNQAEAYAKSAAAHTNDTTFATIPAWEAMSPVLRGEVPVLVHAEDAAQIRSAVEWLVKRKFHGAIVGGSEAARCADSLATNRVPLIYTHEFTLPRRDTDSYDVQYAMPSVLQKAGVTVIFGDGKGTASFVRNLPYDAGQAVAFGLSSEEALKGLTLYPATLFGLKDSLGSIEPGKDATFILADGDVLDPKTRVRRMWIAGQEVDLSSRHTRLYDRYRSRPKPTP